MVTYGMRDAKQTQRRLLKTATQAVADHGIAGLRVDQIALQAKVNKRMIYHYFGDKEGLLASVELLQVEKLSAPLSASEQQVLKTALSISDKQSLNTSGLLGGETSQQQAAVVVLRGLLDRWDSMNTFPNHDLQVLLSKLCQLAFTGVRDNATDDTTDVSKPRVKERFSLRPSLNLVTTRGTAATTERSK